MPLYRSPRIKGAWTFVGATAFALCATLGPVLDVPHFGPSPAYAVCAPDAGLVPNVTCTGTDTDGFVVPGAGINDLIVEQGARVTDITGGPFFGVIQGLAGTVATFSNNGAIEVTDPARSGTVLALITAGDFINTGTIAGGAFADGVSIGAFLNGGVVNSGTITGEGGLIVQSDTSSVANSGTISGTTLYGVAINGSLESFSNTGAVSGAAGLDVRNDLTSLINNGVMQGSLVEGVLVGGTITNLTNAGSVLGADDAIEALNINNLTNFGLISGEDDGIDVDGGDFDNDETSVIGSLINHGTIQGKDDGIDAGTLTSVVNTGTIAGGTTDGLDNAGIAAAIITNIVNSGTISAGSPNDLGYAIEERGRPEILFPVLRPAIAGGDTNLTLNAGSILIGYVDLGGGTNVLNIGQGRSLNSTFDGDIALSSLPLLGKTNGALVAFRDTAGAPDERQVVAVDQSAFLGFDDALYALVSGIGQATQRRQLALRSNPGLGLASSFAATSDPQVNALSAFNDLPLLGPNRFWIEAFGSYRQDQSDRIGGDFDHLTGGLVAGVDVPFDPTTALGVLVGVAGATSENDINTQENEATSFFAGVYGSTSAIGLAWDASLTAGYTAYDQSRETANNLVAGGLETARAEYSGWFINPQITATRQAANPLAGQSLSGFTARRHLEQSLNLSYAGLVLDGYTETGTTNPLTLSDRTIHLASARATLALPFERTDSDGSQTVLRVMVGAEVRTSFGDDSVTGTLLGQTVSTTLDDDTFDAGAFIGLSADHQTTRGMTAFANAEAMIDVDASWQVSAQAGLRIAF